MPKRNFKIFASIVLWTTAALMAAVAGFNWLVDPLSVFGSVRIAGFNAEKVAVGDRRLIAKTYELNRLQPRGLVLGSSRSLELSAEHPGWKVSPVFNMGFAGANAYEILRYFEHANALQRLDRAVIALDFFMFNVHEANRPDFDEARLLRLDGGQSAIRIPRDSLNALFSIDSLWASLQTVTGQPAPGEMAPSETEEVARLMKDGQRAAFIINEGYYFNTVWFKGRCRQEYVLRYSNERGTQLEAFRQLIAMAHRLNVDLHLLVNPSHARLFEALRAAGLWEKFEDWKRSAVQINEEEAVRAGRPPFPFWDFNTVSSIALEPVPAPEDRYSRMAWFVESAHYTAALGDLVLDRVFDHRDPDRRVPDDFGVRLTSDMIEDHLTATLSALDRYRASHPIDVAEIREVAERAATAKHSRCTAPR